MKKYVRVWECLVSKFIWVQRGVRTQESECQLEVEILMDYKSLWAQAVLNLSYQKYSKCCMESKYFKRDKRRWHHYQ